VRRRIGYLPENPPLYPDMTVRSYLLFVARLKGVARARVHTACDEVIERTGLAGVSGRLRVSGVEIGKLAADGTVKPTERLACDVVLMGGGFTPAVIRAKQGVPLRLVFDRQETSSCSEEVVLGDFGVRRFLPAFEKTVVELIPREPGRFDFSCGMGMLHGTLVVER